ncbi:NUDIX domain-containing protein [Bradyrhizobium jicamae]|nr:NUDIX domain-containing protein [Bradyrhizobium jicamae]
MPDRHIAIAVVVATDGRYLFQRRDDIPGIAYPGKLSLFGGHREADETYLACIARELQEEISYPVAPERFELLTSLDGCGEVVDGDVVHGNVFLVRGIPADQVVVTEGSLAIVDAGELISSLARLESDLTPASWFGLKAFLRRYGEAEDRPEAGHLPGL